MADRVEDLNPVLAAVVVYGHQPSASTQIMTASGQVCTAIKGLSPEQPVLLVGGHVAALPERTLREEDADFVAAGEGLHTLVGLVEALKTPAPDLAPRAGPVVSPGRQAATHTRRARWSPTSTAQMPGIAWDLLPMEQLPRPQLALPGRPRPTALRRPLHDARLPVPLLVLLHPGAVQERRKGSGISGVRQHLPLLEPRNRASIRSTCWSSRYGVRNLKIADEMFVLNRRHVLGICDRLIERGYDLNIWAYTRVDTIKDGMLEKLKAAGFNWLAVGIEAGADRVRADVDKAFGQDEVYRVVEQIRGAGINVIGNYIFGLPEDDHETMRATLDLAVDLNCEFANFYSAMAYPGSPLYALAVRAAACRCRRSGPAIRSTRATACRCRRATSRSSEVLRFRDEAFIKYYTNPQYIKMIGRRFGPETVAHLRDVTGHRLERDLLTGRLEVPLTLLPREEQSAEPGESAALLTLNIR